MKCVLPALVIMGMAAAGGYVYYRNGMSEKDRQSVTSEVDSARKLIETIGSRIKPVIDGMTHESEGSMEENRQATKQQWTELGF